MYYGGNKCSFKWAKLGIRCDLNGVTIWFLVLVVIERVTKNRHRYRLDRDDEKIADEEGHVELDERQARVGDQGSEEDDGVEAAKRKSSGRSGIETYKIIRCFSPVLEMAKSNRTSM